MTKWIFLDKRFQIFAMVVRYVFFPLVKLSHGSGLQSADCIIALVILVRVNLPHCAFGETAHRIVLRKFTATKYAESRLDRVPTMVRLYLSIRIYLLTGVRESELIFTVHHKFS